MSPQDWRQTGKDGGTSECILLSYPQLKAESEPARRANIRLLMPDDAYSQLQQHLAEYPDTGDLIQGTGGIRKVRWKLPGTGKSGAVRVIYYWRTAEDQILMLLVYKKTKQDDLSPSQKRGLRRIVENW